MKRTGANWKPSKLSNEDQQKLRDAIQRRSEPNAALQYQWARSLAQTTVFILQKGVDYSPGLSTSFWIRLHGALTELYMTFKKMDDLMLWVQKCPAHGPGADDVRVVYGAYKALEDLRRVLTEDEVIYIDRMRQVESHVLQTYWDLRTKGDELVDTHKIKALDNKEFTIDELEARVSAFPGERDGTQVVEDLAEKVWPWVEEVYLAMRLANGRSLPAGAKDFFK